MGKLRQADIDKLGEGLHGDGEGLAADMNGNRRRWIFRYQRDGKRREIGLGSLADVPLAMARKRAAGYRAELLSGGDPLRSLQMEREQSRQAAAYQQQPTFGEVATELHSDIEAGFRNRKHAAQWITSLQTYCGVIWRRRCDELTPNDAAAVLRPIWLDRPKPRAASGNGQNGSGIRPRPAAYAAATTRLPVLATSITCWRSAVAKSKAPPSIPIFPDA